MSNLINTQLDDRLLYALNNADLNPLNVKVSESKEAGKMIYQVFMDSTIMNYELEQVVKLGFRMIWISTFRSFESNKCILEVAFKEQEN